MQGSTHAKWRPIKNNRCNSSLEFDDLTQNRQPSIAIEEIHHRYNCAHALHAQQLNKPPKPLAGTVWVWSMKSGSSEEDWCASTGTAIASAGISAAASSEDAWCGS